MTKNVTATSYAITAKTGVDWASATPSGGDGISGVSGSISDGSTLTITGAGFGAGPSNHYYEGYNNGTLGSDVTIANTIFDTTTNGGTARAIRDADARSGSFSMSPFQQAAVGAWASLGLTRTFPAVTEVFISYAVKVPSGARFPGNDGGTSGTNADYSSDSSWKTDWVTGGNTSTANDMITPSHIGGGIWATGGNDISPALRNWGTDPTWWKWTKWNRLTTYMKGGATPNVDAGVLYFQVANDTAAIFEDTTTPVIFENGTAPYQWTDARIPGWMRGTVTQNGVKVLYDDVYISTGTNAAARIELGNASTYAGCTNLAICDSSSWADGAVSVTARKGGMDLSQPTWLYLTLGDNTTQHSIQVVT